MERSNKIVKKSNRRRNRRRQRKNIALVSFPTMPSTFRVKLRYRAYDSGSSVTSPLYGRYGILEPLGQPPGYLSAMWSLYKRARIHGATITLKLHNMGSEPVELVVNSLPHNWTTLSPTLAEIVSKPGSVRATASVSGGMDRISISKTVSAAQVLGKDAYLADYDFDSAQAASSTPIQADEPAFVTAVTSFNASTAISYRLEVVIDWDFEFYDQEIN